MIVNSGDELSRAITQKPATLTIVDDAVFNLFQNDLLFRLPTVYAHVNALYDWTSPSAGTIVLTRKV